MFSSSEGARSLSQTSHHFRRPAEDVFVSAYTRWHRRGCPLDGIDALKKNLYGWTYHLACNSNTRPKNPRRWADLASSLFFILGIACTKQLAPEAMKEEMDAEIRTLFEV